MRGCIWLLKFWKLIKGYVKISLHNQLSKDHACKINIYSELRMNHKWSQRILIILCRHMFPVKFIYVYINILFMQICQFFADMLWKCVKTTENIFFVLMMFIYKKLFAGNNIKMLLLFLLWKYIAQKMPNSILHLKNNVYDMKSINKGEINRLINSNILYTIVFDENYQNEKD